MTLSDHQFETEIRPEWRETLKRTNAFEEPDGFVTDWKTYFKMLPKGRDVLKAVAIKSGHSQGRLRGDVNDRRVVPWRHMIAYICVEYLEFSVSKAGRVINRDHSSARYAVEAFRDKLDNLRWRKNLEDVLRTIQ